MKAKVFDPLDEDAVNAWLATPPSKEILSAPVFDTGVDASRHQAALVVYCEVLAVDGEGILPLHRPPAAPAKTSVDWTRGRVGA